MPFVIENSDIPDVVTSESNDFNWLVDCFPASVNAQSRYLSGRLTVDGVDIPIETFSYDEDDNHIGGKLEVVLARNSDSAAFTRTASIKFETGERLSGVWTWKIRFESGRLSGITRELATQDGQPRDKVIVIATPLLQSRLETSPQGTVVHYDPNKLTLTEADFIDVPDINGVSHLVTLTATAGLSTHSIFSFVASVCGFAGYVTNIPDFPLRRVDFPPGEPYWNAVAGIIGIFKAHEGLDIDADDRLVLRDCTADLLPDSDASVALTVDRLVSMGDSRDIERFKGTLLTYQEQGLGWDYWQDTVEHDDHDNTSGISTSRETYVRNYYRRSFPHTPVKSQRTLEHKFVYNGPLGGVGGLIAASGEQLSYTDLGLLSGREKRTFSRSKAPDSWVTFCGDLPTPGFDTEFIGPEASFTSASDATFTNAVVLSHTERESMEYQAHPYEVDQVYMRRRERETRGLITKDSDNPQLDEDFSQPLLTAQRAGNLASGQGSFWGQVGFEGEEQVPQRNRGVLIRSFKSDSNNADGEALLPEDWEDPRQGDIGISIKKFIQKQLYVTDGADSTAKLFFPLNAGECPLSIAKPLAIRYNRAQYYPGSAQMVIPGFDLGLVRGRSIAPSDRQGTSYGTYRITGFTITGGNGKYQTSIRAKQIGSADVVASSADFVNDVSGLSLESGQSKIVTIKVQCWNGQILSVPSVADLTVEARHGHAGSWTAEGSTIDVSAYDGSLEEFEIRFTAPTVTSHYVRSVTITVGPS